jgi:hypothetical protein
LLRVKDGLHKYLNEPLEFFPRKMREFFNREFDSYAQVCGACCLAWNKLTAETGRIASIATREWAIIGQNP